MKLSALGRNSTLSLVQAVLNILTLFFVMRLLVLTSGTEAVGLWSLTMGYISLVRLLDFSGAGGTSRMVATQTTSDGRSSCIDSMTVFVASIYALLGTCAFWMLSTFVPSTVPEEFRSVATDLIFWTAIALPLSVIMSVQCAALDGIGRADIRALLNCAGFIVFAALALFWLPERNVVGLAQAQITQYVFVLLGVRFVLWFKLKSLAILPTRFSWTQMRDSLHYGIRLQFSSIPMAIFDPMARIMLNHFAGLSYLGIYDLAYRVAGNLRGLIQSALNPLVPEFTSLYQRDPSEAKQSHDDKLDKFLLANCAVFSLVILSSPLISWLLLGEINGQFLLALSCLSFAWGGATLGLLTQLFARAAGVLRWSILGQWSLLLMTGPIVWLANSVGGTAWLAAGLGASILLGHTISYAGELRYFDVKSAYAARRTVKSAITFFIAIWALSIAFVAGFLV